MGDSMLIDSSKKKCLIETIIATKDTSKLATENIFKKCKIDSPYESLPLKQACVKGMNDHCEKVGFNDLVMSSTKQISSSDETNTKKCEAPSECLNLPMDKEVTEAEKKKCGVKLLNLFSPTLMKPKFGAFTSPCEVIEETKTTSFIEMKQAPKAKTTTKTTTTTPAYVDMKDKDVSENVKRLSNIANGVVESSNISIDDNTATRTNTVSDSDMDAINKDTDTLVKDAIVEEPTKPTNNGSTNNGPTNNGSYNGENNFPGKYSGSGDYKGMKNGTMWTILCLIVAILL